MKIMNINKLSSSSQKATIIKILSYKKRKMIKMRKMIIMRKMIKMKKMIKMRKIIKMSKIYSKMSKIYNKIEFNNKMESKILKEI